jgi:hypothetical protein
LSVFVRWKGYDDSANTWELAKDWATTDVLQAMVIEYVTRHNSVRRNQKINPPQWLYACSLERACARARVGHPRARPRAKIRHSIDPGEGSNLVPSLEKWLLHAILALLERILIKLDGDGGDQKGRGAPLSRTPHHAHRKRPRLN